MYCGENLCPLYNIHLRHKRPLAPAICFVLARYIPRAIDIFNARAEIELYFPRRLLLDHQTISHRLPVFRASALLFPFFHPRTLFFPLFCRILFPFQRKRDARHYEGSFMAIIVVNGDAGDAVRVNNGDDN